ncbi:zinc finger, CCHC-type containing protein [Tanacetum coccineum]
MFNKSFQVYYVTYVSEAYFVQDNDVAWWVDSGATVHVYKDRCWFKTYESLNDDLYFSLGNIVFVVTEEVVQQPELKHRKSKRNRTPKDFRPEFQLYLIEGTRDEDVALWKDINNDGWTPSRGNNTWVLADLPLGKASPSSFKHKVRNRLNLIYALWARISTIRLLIAMTSIHNMIIHQMDVKITFLNGDLEEEVYMNQPHGFIMPSNENKVYLYKEFLSSKFSMKDMGEADVILGIGIKHGSNGITISQSHYIEKSVSMQSLAINLSSVKVHVHFHPLSFLSSILDEIEMQGIANGGICGIRCGGVSCVEQSGEERGNSVGVKFEAG